MHESCFLTFSRRESMTTHYKRKHTNIRNHVCANDSCDESYATAWELRQHKSHSHTKNKKYECPECSYKCVDKGTLKNHVNHVHKNIKTHKCNFCEMMFAARENLKSHINVVHKNIRELLCPNENCDAVFAKKTNLKRHLKLCTNGRCGSAGEVKVKEALEKMGFVINKTYIYNKTYPKLTQFAESYLKFDFLVPLVGDPVVIEYDGECHYVPVNWRGGEENKLQSLEDFEEYKKRDNIKTQFCEDNDIMLLRIPYWEYDNIKTLVRDFIELYTTWDP